MLLQLYSKLGTVLDLDLNLITAGDIAAYCPELMFTATPSGDKEVDFDSMNITVHRGSRKYVLNQD